MFFVMSLRLSDHKVLHNIAPSSSFFRFCSNFLAFSALISHFKFLEFKEFNKTIIPFALVGYETGYGYLLSVVLLCCCFVDYGWDPSSDPGFILGFHSPDETAMLVYKTMAQCRSSFA